MISLKKYLDEAENFGRSLGKPDAKEVLPAALEAYRAALMEMGCCSLDVCPGLGGELQQSLKLIGERLCPEITCDDVQATGKDVQEKLHAWGVRAAKHGQQSTREIKEILITMARTAESVGQRDQRCAIQIDEVTSQLQKIATLDDLTQIRSSLKRSAAALKTSIDKMAAEGKAAVEQARAEITGYQEKLEKAEEIASRDALTGLRSRLWMERQIDYWIAERRPLCVAMLDLNEFKKVNDVHGHLVGDDVLKHFGDELKLVCRSSDVIGRWGGDEFIILLDCDLKEAQAQARRLTEWVCGDYTVQGKTGPVKLRLVASIGLAEHQAEETMNELLERADKEMYEQKALFKAGRGAGQRSSRLRA